MRPWSDWLRGARQWARGEGGSVTLEFLGLGVMLLVPIAYGAITLVRLEQAVLATELASRNAARVLATNPVDHRDLAETHVTLALSDLGFDPDDAAIDVRCAPQPDCVAPGDTLTVTVRIHVGLPGIPFSAEWLHVPVEADATFPRTNTGTPRGSAP